MRASRAVAPDGVTSSGLTSSSAISGWAAANRLSARRPRGQRPRRRAPARPRCSSSSGAVRSRRSIRAASCSSTGPERDLDVAQHLGRRTAHADEHGRAEARVPAAADDQLDAAAQVGHLLDRERRRGQPLDQLARGRRHSASRSGSPTTTPPASDLCSRPERLEHVRRAQLAGRGRSARRRCGPRGRRRRGRPPRRTRRGTRSSRSAVTGAAGLGSGSTRARRARRRSSRPARRRRPRSRRTPGRRRRARIRQAGASGKIDWTATGLRPAASAAICLAAAHSAGPRPVSPSSPLE